MEEQYQINLFSIQVDPDGMLVCVIGDEQKDETVGFYPTEELMNLFRDLFTFMKATTDFSSFRDSIESARTRLDEAWERRYLMSDE